MVFKNSGRVVGKLLPWDYFRFARHSPGEALPGCNDQVVGTTGSMRGIAFVRSWLLILCYKSGMHSHSLLLRCAARLVKQATVFIS
jgi:hypothetical protein